VVAALPESQATKRVRSTIPLIIAQRDEPLLQKYRDAHYALVLDQLQATGQHIANRQGVTPFTDAKRQRLMNRHQNLARRICNRYSISGFEGGDPYIIERGEWLATLRVPTGSALQVKTNWQTSLYALRCRFAGFSDDATLLSSCKGIVVQLPQLPKCPQWVTATDDRSCKSIASKAQSPGKTRRRV
jgi:hypothetical protein